LKIECYCLKKLSILRSTYVFTSFFHSESYVLQVATYWTKSLLRRRDFRVRFKVDYGISLTCERTNEPFSMNNLELLLVQIMSHIHQCVWTTSLFSRKHENRNKNKRKKSSCMAKKGSLNLIVFPSIFYHYNIITFQLCWKI
jgi:hypothetical protein